MTQTSQENTVPLLELNGQTSIRNYSVEVVNSTYINKKKEHSCVAMLFSLQYLGLNEEGNLKYRLIVSKRLFLDEQSRPVFKPSKAQKIALAVAKINDELFFEVSKEYGLLGIYDSDKIQAKWTAIRNHLIESYPDLETIIEDFDWQLQKENIQALFKADNFYNFFFANVFYQEFDDDKLLSEEKTIANGFSNLDIPIIERRYISKQDMLFQNIMISTQADLDTENEKFPLAKMNVALGHLLNESDVKHNLKFTYDGTYQVKPRIGLITGGTLEYEFKIPEIYQKTTTINFNLENDER